MSRYINPIERELNKIAGKDIYSDFCFEMLCSLDESQKMRIAQTLLGFACCSGTYAWIEISRALLILLPVEWLATNIRIIVDSGAVIDLNDEWDYRRLLELSELISDDLLKWVIEKSVGSTNEEVLEAADDYR